MSLTKVTYAMIQDEAANVKDYGAKGDGITNDSAAIQAAINANRQVYFPPGRYLCNVVMGESQLFGSGSRYSILQPYNTAIAALTVRRETGGFAAEKVITGLGFDSGGLLTGVGLTFGTTDITLVAAAGGTANNPNNASGTYGFNFLQYAGPTTMVRDCQFTNFQKAIQMPVGNIALVFENCGIYDNYYGIYCLSNRIGGDAMQAGIKTFKDCWINSNKVGFYVWASNSTAPEGMFNFHDCIFDTNKIAMYSYINVGYQMRQPILITGTWFEANVNSESVSVDYWAGTTPTPTSINTRAFIFNGDQQKVSFRDCGIISDIFVQGTNTVVTIENCRVERELGVGGRNSTVDVSNSLIHQNNCFSFSAGMVGANVLSTGYISQELYSITPSGNQNKWVTVPPRSAIVSNYGTSKLVAVPFTSGEPYSGTFSGTASTVSDGRIYGTCNTVTRSAGSAWNILFTNSSLTNVAAGYVVFTLDAKVVAGNPYFSVSDLSGQNVAAFMTAETDRWVTYSGLSQTTGTEDFSLWASADGSVDCTFRISAYQVHRFDTLVEAQAFMNGLVYGV